MRTVLRNHNEVAHIWAQQTQQHGRASNMFFHGASIYSYGEHYTLAKFQENGSVLINSESPSVSTSKHASIVRGSIPDSIKSFEVPSTGSERYERSDRTNLKHYASKFAFYIKKASKARKYLDLYLTRAKGTRSQAFDYSETFDCKHLLKDFDFEMFH